MVFTIHGGSPRYFGYNPMHRSQIASIWVYGRFIGVNAMIGRPVCVDGVMKYPDMPFVKVLTGVRRSGKSTILKLLVKKLREEGVPAERILQYQFDSMEREDIKTAKALYDELKQRLSPPVHLNTVCHRGRGDRVSPMRYTAPYALNARLYSMPRGRNIS